MFFYEFLLSERFISPLLVCSENRVRAEVKKHVSCWISSNTRESVRIYFVLSCTFVCHGCKGLPTRCCGVSARIFRTLAQLF